MNYLILPVLFVFLVFILIKLLSSLVKGLVTAALILVVCVLGYYFYMTYFTSDSETRDLPVTRQVRDRDMEDK